MTFNKQNLELYIYRGVVGVLITIVGFFLVRYVNTSDDAYNILGNKFEETTKAMETLNRSVIINTEALKGKTTKDQEQDGRIYKLEETTGKHTSDIEVLKAK